MSGDLQVTRVDVSDDTVLAAWHGVLARSDRHDHGDLATTWTLPELTADLRSGRRQLTTVAYLGTHAGEPVAWGLARLPQLDNTSAAEVGVAVDPVHRRRGLGSTMLAHVEREVADAGRSVLSAEATWPHRQPRDGVGEAGVEFARRHGYVVGNVEVMRRLPLPVEDSVLDRLADEAAPRHEGYTLRAWVGPVPEDLLETWAVLTASLSTEAPTGDLHVEPETADVEAVRENEQLLVAQGRTAYRAVALAPDGVAVGYTEVVTTIHEPGRAYQWGTLVHGEHRGHRLGVALKVASHRLLQRSVDPAGPVTSVITWNADSNAHMVAVNKALGFEPVSWCGLLQKRR